jgi:hypothetical protein
MKRANRSAPTGQGTVSRRAPNWTQNHRASVSKQPQKICQRCSATYEGRGVLYCPDCRQAIILGAPKRIVRKLRGRRMLRGHREI